MNVKKLVRIALLCAISVILVYLIHFPLIPGATFLEYDPADVCLLITGLFYGAGWGILATIVVSVVQGMTVSATSGWIGILMHILSTSCFVAVTSLFYRKGGKLIPSLVSGGFIMVLVMIPLNLIFTGMFMGAGVGTVVKMLIPAIIPFNTAKAVINCVLCAILYKRIKKFL